MRGIDILLSEPLQHCVGADLRSVNGSQAAWWAANSDQLLQIADVMLATKIGRHLNVMTFPGAFAGHRQACDLLAVEKSIAGRITDPNKNND